MIYVVLKCLSALKFNACWEFVDSHLLYSFSEDKRKQGKILRDDVGAFVWLSGD